MPMTISYHRAVIRLSGILESRMTTMTRLRRRSVAAASALILLASLALASATAAAADPTFLSMSSQPGDYIGQGLTHYFTPATAGFTPSYDGSLARFAVITPGYTEWWYVTIAAPPGQPLVAGSYANAVRAEFRGPGQPGLDMYGDGRGCNTLTGSFTVLHALYGPGNTVVQFDATFEQHCEGATPALTGEIRYDATPGLTLGVTINTTGTVGRSTGQATVGGTVSCSFPVTVTIGGTVAEPVKHGTASGPFSVQVPCTGSPTPWATALSSTTGRAFAAGGAQVSLSGSASDAFSGQQTSITAVGTTTLTLVR
jgi:hypothetical protein